MRTEESTQAWPMSAQCPTGGAEAERIFQLGLDYFQARKGLLRDLPKADKLFREALEMGSAKAALNLGYMRRLKDPLDPANSNYHEFMLEMYNKGIEMGCPEGLNLLAEAYYYGWGVPKSEKKAQQLLRKSAEQGGLYAMTALGVSLCENDKIAEGKAWLKKALEAGCSNAAFELYWQTWQEKNAEEMLHYLRLGAKMGNTMCLFSMNSIYRGGKSGQLEDVEYADRILHLWKTIPDDEVAKPIPNFDELIPPKPVLPFKE